LHRGCDFSRRPSIEGTVFYRGAVPTKTIIPTKDVEVCGDPREEPLIRVGAGQAVESAVVYLVEVAKGKPWPAAGKTPEIDNVKCHTPPIFPVADSAITPAERAR
jgi:hypothetical protein